MIDRQSETDLWRGGLRRDFSMSSSLQLTALGKSSDEYTPFNKTSSEIDMYGTSNTSKKAPLSETLDFFGLIQQEIDKVNKFFVGKMAELRIYLDQITSKRRHVYFSHHTSAETELVKLRDIYVQLAALRSYCDLNQTGNRVVSILFLSLNHILFAIYYFYKAFIKSLKSMTKYWKKRYSDIIFLY